MAIRPQDGNAARTADGPTNKIPNSEEETEEEKVRILRMDLMWIPLLVQDFAKDELGFPVLNPPNLDSTHNDESDLATHTHQDKQLPQNNFYTLLIIPLGLPQIYFEGNSEIGKEQFSKNGCQQYC